MTTALTTNQNTELVYTRGIEAKAEKEVIRLAGKRKVTKKKAKPKK
jgi:hypothetical protein